jgi:uncharacterized protein YbgA (DUF1722 family)/uncharacterized protein YbbK (DUF523 family)
VGADQADYMTYSIVVGVSACLLGEHVRYDGGHKQDYYITDTLGRYFSFVPVCPEVECGMPIPRESMRLEGDRSAPRLMTSQTRIDMTDRMLAFCSKKIRELEKLDLCGFIFKKNSPSSGLFRVKIFNRGQPAKYGSGLFAAAMAGRFPQMPMEEEERLNDPDLRENFIDRVYCYRRWKDLLASVPSVGSLVDFHTAHTLQMMSHSQQIYRELGTLVTDGSGMKLENLLQRYAELFMKGLAFQATTTKNTHVLQHIAGYFKHQLSPVEKAVLREAIMQYHDRLVPLVVPITLLRHYIVRYDQHYLKSQTYLESGSAQLMLPNHVLGNNILKCP